MTEEKNNSLRYAAGLLLGIATTAAAAFLYKTESGKKAKKILCSYYREAQNHFHKLAQEFSSSGKVDRVVTKEVKKIRKKINLIKKNVFSKSGKPLVK